MVDDPEQAQGYRRAFAGFEIDKVARFTPAKVEKLLTDTGIIRNRAKVQATIRNAQRSSTCSRSSARSTPTSGASSAAARW